jgi:redox-sensitive bicupin YhaK (pirin superfamily)
MIEVRKFATLGGGNHGWLNAHHHFSFAEYQAAERTRWGALRVWNDDEIAPNSGFPPHPHANMEIITYVRQGAITHKDSLGNVGRTEAGDVQVMSAGTGIRHSEWNAELGLTTLFQIWIIPDQAGGAPAWGARQFPRAGRDGHFVSLASGMEGDTDALPIRANARVAGTTLQAGQTTEYSLAQGRRAYLVPARGRITLNGVELEARDGAAVADETTLRVTALDDAEIVLVDAA